MLADGHRGGCARRRSPRRPRLLREQARWRKVRLLEGHRPPQRRGHDGRRMGHAAASRPHARLPAHVHPAADARPERGGGGTDGLPRGHAALLRRERRARVARRVRGGPAEGHPRCRVPWEDHRRCPGDVVPGRVAGAGGHRIHNFPLAEGGCARRRTGDCGDIEGAAAADVGGEGIRVAGSDAVLDRGDGVPAGRGRRGEGRGDATPETRAGCAGACGGGAAAFDEPAGHVAVGEVPVRGAVHLGCAARHDGGGHRPPFQALRHHQGQDLPPGCVLLHRLRGQGVGPGGVHARPDQVQERHPHCARAQVARAACRRKGAQQSRAAAEEAGPCPTRPAGGSARPDVAGSMPVRKNVVYVDAPPAAGGWKETPTPYEAPAGQKRKREGEIPWHPFDTDYGDHFETNDDAVTDIAHVITALARSMGIKPKKLRIYDPYYCAGSIKGTWESAGFPKCYNENEDCYKVWAEGRQPGHDVLITNPPFSADHKERCIRQCVQNGKPWLLLLPGYCATKQYFSEIVGDERPIFLVPNTSYKFTHPEGTGYDESPFYSIWMGSFGKHHTKVVQEARKNFSSKVRVEESIDALKRNKDVPTAKRPNPRARAKRRKAAAGGEEW